MEKGFAVLWLNDLGERIWTPVQSMEEGATFQKNRSEHGDMLCGITVEVSGKWLDATQSALAHI